jgi:hypothetical protein
MKKSLHLVLLLFISLQALSQIGIKSDGSAPLSSAQLEVQSTNKAFYPPRMTTAQKNAIPLPQSGAVVYDTDLKILNYFDGSQWLSTGANNNTKRNIYNGAQGEYTLNKLASTNAQSAAYNQLNPSFITTDNYGNYYVMGMYNTQNVNLYKANGQSAITLNLIGSDDIFVAKYNSADSLIWAARLGGVSSDIGYSMEISSGGDKLIIAGFFNSSSLNIYNGRASGSIAETSWGQLNSTSKDGFIIQYSTNNGSVDWVARQSGNSIESGSIAHGPTPFLAVNKSGNGVVTLYEGRTNSSLAEVVWGVQTFNGSGGALIIQYNTNGSISKVAKAEGFNMTCGDIVTSSNSLYANFSATTSSQNTYSFHSFKSSAGASSVVWNGNVTGVSDTFLVKYSLSSNNVEWVSRQVGGETCYSLAIDIWGDVYTLGYARSEFYPYESFNIKKTITSSSTTETSWGDLSYEERNLGFLFLIKYTSSFGDIVWATSLSHTNRSASVFAIGSSNSSLVTDNYANVYVGGYISSSSLNVYNSKNKGTSSQSLFQSTPNVKNAKRGFLVKFNQAGKGQWLDRITTTDIPSSNHIQGISINYGGNPNNVPQPTIFGIGNAAGSIQLGTQNLNLFNGLYIGDNYIFKYKEID